MGRFHDLARFRRAVLGVAIVGQVALVMMGDGTFVLALLTTHDQQGRSA